MTVVRRLVRVVLVLILTPLPASPQTKPDDRPVAIVTEANGETWAESKGVDKHPIRALDWASAGTVLATGRGATMVVVFQNGMRTRLAERSKLRVTAAGPADTAGTATALPAVPPLPPVSLVVLEGTITRINAVRVRGEGFTRLYPDGATVMADDAWLSFEPSRDFSFYAVAIEGEDGTVVFETTSSATSISVPPSVLQPGARYYWRVSAQDALGTSVRGAGRFQALTTEQVSRRQALHQEHWSSPADLAMLAEVDRSLGLLREAFIGFGLARAREGSAPHVAERWQELNDLLPGPR